LVRDADAAMYAAKSAGTGSWRVFEPAMHDAVVARLEIEGELRGAVERNELVLHYQPIIALSSGAVVGYEALLRWQHPVRGLVAPGEFVAIAEDNGMIVPIGRWVLEESCRSAAAWPPSAEGHALDLSVNLSARQLFDTGLVDTVAGILTTTKLDPARLTLEITESVLMEDTALAVLQLRALRAVGVRLAIDDFGTGYSSLSYLRSFPVDSLKVDKSFIDSVHVDIEGACFVQAILHLAQVMRVRTVAEGVEHEAQAERLRELGCDQAQGFYFGRPRPLPVVDAPMSVEMSEASPQAIPPESRSLVGAKD
jgi:EAL domain-containing protein (putative c-di-GMP-specific phosphodiesterase class I)